MDSNEELLTDLYDQVLEQLELAIECFEQVATPKIHGGEETNPRVVKCSAVPKWYTKSHHMQHYSFKKHMPWKECCKWGKRWGDRVDKREDVCRMTTSS